MKNRALLIAAIATTLSSQLLGIISPPIFTMDNQGQIVVFSDASDQNGPWNQPTHASNQIIPLPQPTNTAFPASGQIEQQAQANRTASRRSWTKALCYFLTCGKCGESSN